MSNTIQPFAQPPLPETANGQTSVPAAALPQAASQQAAQGAAQRDSVTLSAAAQTGAELLGAAGAADGIDHAAVAVIKSQLANGSYNVSPENLAQAIATVLKETKQ